MRIRDIGLVYECQSTISIYIHMYIFIFIIGYENLIKAFEKARRVLEKDQGRNHYFFLVFDK